jgi:hemerythrin-like domain-containing protein
MTEPFNPPYEGATLDQLRNPNVQHFLQLHGYLRYELQMMLQLVDELTREADFNQNMLRSLMSAGSRYAQHLHAHHHGETQLMFPVLEREGLAKEIVARLNREHDEIGSLIEKVSGSLFQMRTAEFPEIKENLRQLGNSLRTHLDYEEKHVCPLLSLWDSPGGFYAALFTR